MVFGPRSFSQVRYPSPGRGIPSCIGGGGVLQDRSNPQPGQDWGIPGWDWCTSQDRTAERILATRILLAVMQEDFIFLSFEISYLDFGWVKEVMMKGMKRKSRRIDLEKQYGYRLVIGNRDWLGGKVIIRCIMDSIQKSRKVIFILSR